MPQDRVYRAGASIEDFCRACKTDRTHTIIAVDGEGTPLRVACGFCRSEHNYRGGPRADTTAASASAKPGPRGIDCGSRSISHCDQSRGLRLP